MSEWTKTKIRLGQLGGIVGDEDFGHGLGTKDTEYYGGHLLAESIRRPENAQRIVDCWNELLDVPDPHEMRESIRCVVATLNGETYGLTVEDQLEALRMACRALEESIGDRS